MKYRKSGQSTWRTGLPLRFHPVDTPKCKADYRGTLVNLSPATAYEIELSLKGTDVQNICTASTWNETYPVKTTIKTESSSKTLNIDK